MSETHSDIQQLSETVQHIGLKLDKTEFLMPVSMVREIIMLPSITYVPKVKAEGVIALRGEIMPVINLRKALKFPKGQVTPATRLLILPSANGAFGLIVDEIADFVLLGKNDIEDIPANFFSADYTFLSGVSKQGGKARGIIDALKLLATISEAA